jgi:hypothetical protein
MGKSGGSQVPSTPSSAAARSVPEKQKIEPAPPQAGETPAKPQAPGASGERVADFAALPPPAAMDQQIEFAPLPPPPPLGQQDEAVQPPVTPSQDTPTTGNASPSWPWTAPRPITSGDLNQLSPWELVLIRNEIYARHGWVFQRVELQAHFEQQPWYRPKGTVANHQAANRLAEAALTPLERQNLRAISDYEKAQQGRR